MLELLSHDPEYKTNKAIDPVDFIQLFNSFNTAPVFSIGIIGGANITTPNLLETFSTNSFYEANAEYHNGGVGFAIGLKTNYHINSFWDISTEPTFTALTYSVTENATLYNSTTITEKMNIIALPIFGSYYFYERNKFKFFGDMGLSYNHFLSGSIDGIVSYNNNELPDIEPPSISTKEIRKKYNLTGIIGIGTKIDLNRSNIQATIRYNIGLSNIVNSDMRYSDYEGLNSKYLFIDNDISLNGFNLMISYNLEFYVHNKKSNNHSNYDLIK